MRLSRIQLKKHPILGDIDISLINPESGKPYSTVAFVGENGCGKTTLLNELSHYEKPEVNDDKKRPKDAVEKKTFNAIFLRQNGLFTDSMADIYQSITGIEYFKTARPTPSDNSDNKDFRRDVPINDSHKVLPILEAFQNEHIVDVFKSDKLNGYSSSGEVLRSINGVKPELDSSMFSSGENELLLKLRHLKELRLDTDFVLLDEPETSLHPKWQRAVVDVIAAVIGAEGQQDLQFFVATHSERVLESLVGKGDTLIVHLYREDEKIAAKPINLMNLLLPRLTYAELDYVIFDVPSFDYHDQLLTVCSSLFNVDTISSIDKRIQETPQYGKGDFAKRWEKPRPYPATYETLPVYIRNWFHHPSEDHAEPTEEELVRSIEFLKDIIISKRSEKA